MDFRYNAEDAVGDIVAGITVGLTVIPQALAYSGIAGLPPAVSILQFFKKISFFIKLFAVWPLLLVYRLFGLHFPWKLQGCSCKCTSFAQSCTFLLNVKYFRWVPLQ